MVTEIKKMQTVSHKIKVNVTDPGSQPHKPVSKSTVCISQFSCFLIADKMTNYSELYGCKGDWSVLALGSERWWVLKNVVMNLQVP
jgi:hypothetical protein